MNNEFTGFVYAMNRQLTQRAAGLRGTDNAQASPRAIFRRRARFMTASVGPEGEGPRTESPWEDWGQPPKIGDYGIIGNCRTAALISRDGSLDWLCLPRFDSQSVFAAILDDDLGGRFRIRPKGPFRSERRYLPETAIIETRFHTPSGSFALLDLMPVSSEDAKRDHLQPQHEILRKVEGLEGETEFEVVYEPRPDYGRKHVQLSDRGALGIWCAVGTGHLVLRTELPVQLGPDAVSASGTFRIRAGERYFLSLSFDRDAPAIIPVLGDHAQDRVETTITWWRDWAGHSTYNGPYREAVTRSALTLKLLTYAPSGAIVAAPTTSLPEYVGGSRNWDYRYCWLRDASFTVDALLSLGFGAEAEAFLGWMLHATRLSLPDLQILYNVYGETRLPERELDHLSGHYDSRPVRIGNDAQQQIQLDVYGEFIDAASQFSRRGRQFDATTAALLKTLGDTVCRRWREADEGIWEGRAGRFQHTHSKVLCWVALQRLTEMHDTGVLTGDPRRWKRERDEIRAVVESQGYNEGLGSYTRTLDGDELDASLLTLPLHEYVEAGAPRMMSTLLRIQKELSIGHLIYRYAAVTDDGLPPGEGAFGICSFWAVQCMARAGLHREAVDAFESLLAFQNDLGLFAEEIDPVSGAALGNFPQAFTHVGLINAALDIEVGSRSSLPQSAPTALPAGPLP